MRCDLNETSTEEVAAAHMPRARGFYRFGKIYGGGYGP